LFAVPMSFHQSGITQNPQVMGDMRLGITKNVREIGHTFFAQEEGF